MEKLKKLGEWWDNSVPLPFHVVLGVNGLLFIVGGGVWLLSGEDALLLVSVNVSTFIVAGLAVYWLVYMIKDIVSNVRYIHELERQEELRQRENRLRQIIREELRHAETQVGHIVRQELRNLSRV